MTNFWLWLLWGSSILLWFSLSIWHEDYKDKKREKNYRIIRNKIEEENSPKEIKQARLDFLDLAYITGGEMRLSKKKNTIAKVNL
jgi:hypothetical protein